MTTLQTSIKGNEQRAMIFTWPRRTLSYSLLTNDFYQMAFIKRKIHKNLHKVWGIPFWQDRTVLTSPAASGQKILHVKSTQYRNFEVGASCVLFASERSYEVGVVGVLASDQITLVSDLSAAWPQRTEVYPILKARIKSGQEMELKTSGVGAMSIEAQEEFDDSITRYVGSDSAYPTYLDVSIFNPEPNWEIMKMSFVDPYDLLSFFGKVTPFSHYDEGEIGLKTDFLLNGKAAIWKLLDFFDSKRGRWGAFWLPTWMADFTVTEPFLASATQLKIKDMGYLADWLGTKAGRYVTLLWPDNTRICRRIIGAPSSTELTLDSPIGRASSSTELKRMVTSFMFLSRFGIDEVEIEHVTDGVAKVILSFQSIFTEWS